MEVKTGSYRVAIFNAYEVHGKNAGGEWVRLDAESSPRLHDTINEFVFENSLLPVNISAPAIVLVHSDEHRRVFRTGVSVIYTQNDVEQPVIGKTKEQRLRDIADAIRDFGSEELNTELNEILRSDDGAWFRSGVAKYNNSGGNGPDSGEQS